MPDLPNRAEREQQLARLLGRYFSGRLRDLLDELGDPPNLNNLSQAWYDSLNEVQVPLQDVLQAIYLESAEGLLNSQPTGVDWGLVNERAVRWAKEYSFGLVKGINNTTRNLLREVIPTAFEEPLTLRQIKDRLSGTFGPVRAEMIAVTEVTRAAAEGELAFADELRKKGVQMVTIGQTNNDEIVKECPICFPRHGKERGDGWEEPPPAHPRCRCWITHEAKLING